MPQLGCQASSSFTTRQPPELPLSIGVLDTSGEEVFVIRRAPVAQLDRASGFEPAGRRFNSCRAHQRNRGLMPLLVQHYFRP